MSEQVISDDVLNNMGSLESLLSERGYTTATVPMNGETVVRNEFGPGADPVPAAGLYAPPGVVPTIPAGVVPGTSPAPQPANGQQPVQPYLLQGQVQPRPQRPADVVSREQYEAAMTYAARMQQAAEATARAKLEAEDEAFLADVKIRFPGDEVAQDREILIRYNQQLQEANQAMANRYQSDAAQREAREQLESKYEVAEVLATKAGIPWELPGVQAALMNAPTRQQMDVIIDGLRAMTPRQQQQLQQTPAQVAGQIVAAPARGGGGRAAPAVKPHSGDIMGLLKNRSYQLVAE